MGIIKASKLIFDYIRHDEEEKAVEVDRAIDGLSLDIAKGSFVAILGHNGSGKTVLFKCICGFYQVTKGEILINKKKVGIGDQMPGNIAFTIEEPAFQVSTAAEKT